MHEFGKKNVSAYHREKTYNTSMKKLIRPKNGRVLGGVSAAIANAFDIDVTLVRIIWVFLLLPGGFPGVIPYLLMWIIIPEDTLSA